MHSGPSSWPRRIASFITGAPQASSKPENQFRRLPVGEPINSLPATTKPDFEPRMSGALPYVSSIDPFSESEVATHIWQDDEDDGVHSIRSLSTLIPEATEPHLDDGDARDQDAELRYYNERRERQRYQASTIARPPSRRRGVRKAKSRHSTTSGNTKRKGTTVAFTSQLASQDNDTRLLQSFIRVRGAIHVHISSQQHDDTQRKRRDTSPRRQKRARAASLDEPEHIPSRDIRQPQRKRSKTTRDPELRTRDQEPRRRNDTTENRMKHKKKHKTKERTLFRVLRWIARSHPV